MITRARRAGGWLPRRGRRLAIVLLLAAGAMAGAVVAAAPAGAAATTPAARSILNPFSSCKTPPNPQQPGDGAPGWFEPRPSPLPPAGQAFGPHPTSTEYVQYGFAGLSWSTYDLGCAAFYSGGAANPVPVIGTLLGNWFLGSAKTIVAIDSTVHAWASSTSWQQPLYPVVAQGTRAIHAGLWSPWVIVTLLIFGITLTLQLRGSDLASAVSGVAWVLMVLALVATLTAYPTWAAREASTLMSPTLNALDAGFVGPGGQKDAAEAHSSLLVQDVLFPAWERGEFGSSTSATARTYGGQLLENQSLSWAQSAGSQQEINSTTHTEQGNWAQIASKIQGSDPQAYDSLKGTAMGRLSAGALAFFAALVTCTFDIFASITVMIALITVMVAVILLPGIAAVAIHPGMRGLLTGVGSHVASTLMSAVLWAAAAGIDARATSIVLGARFTTTGRGALANMPKPPLFLPMPTQLAMLILLLLPIGLYIMVRKIRNRRVIPRPVMMAATFLGMRGAMRRSLRRGARQGVAEGIEAATAGAGDGTGNGVGPGGFSPWDGPFGYPTWQFQVPRDGLPPAPPPAPPLPPPGGGSGPRPGGGGGPLPPGGGGGPLVPTGVDGHPGPPVWQFQVPPDGLPPATPSAPPLPPSGGGRPGLPGPGSGGGPAGGGATPIGPGGNGSGSGGPRPLPGPGGNGSGPGGNGSGPAAPAPRLYTGPAGDGSTPSSAPEITPDAIYGPGQRPASTYENPPLYGGGDQHSPHGPAGDGGSPDGWSTAPIPED